MTLTLLDEKNDHRTQEEKQLSPDIPPPDIANVPCPRFSLQEPGPDYIAPSASFFFSSGDFSPMEEMVPPQPLADRFMAYYWTSVHPVARILHRPSFQKKYETFWSDIYNHRESPYSLQALVFSTLFAGAVSMPVEHYSRREEDKLLWVGRCQAATENCLGRANVIRTTKVETLQAFVMYLVRQRFLYLSPRPLQCVHFRIQTYCRHYEVDIDQAKGGQKDLPCSVDPRIVE